ncbi:hypothetical protein YPPY46_1603, partial [Yersinia pestis PY-46]|jgi:two-component system response regulator ChvI
MSHS